ncbi:ATPase [Xylanibacillus composti]|uniref:ATPase n=1 Tax=Xylanibacillus composti TaxID=1572762 RepID=A0A8J4M2V4_9BACL|nr:SRPBCC family protein [Xylanibacillus composti]MDT9724580.1 ATPase [Xylanibacillus composti]GIQ70260.1 ATPase [Xylanibacillus composti]
MSKTTIIAEPNKQEIIISRTFEAPCELVFQMWTDPAYIPEWWGPSFMTTTVESLDAKNGGMWRFIHRDPNGKEYAHRGVFHEVASPNRLIQTHELEFVPTVGLITVTFEEAGAGRTKMTETSLYPSVEIRDELLRSGLTEGMDELLDRFASLLDMHSQRSLP